MRRLAHLLASAAFTIAAVLAAALPSEAQTSSLTAPAPVTCAPATGTLAAVGDKVTLNCPGAANYLVTLQTPNGTALAGTITSTDSGTGGPRRFIKTGVGPLDVSSIILTGTQGAGLMEYRFTGGGDGETITLTAASAGSAQVTIRASFSPVATFINGEVQSSEESALRAGRAYTASTGTATVANGNYLNFLLTNPAASTKRLIITHRLFSCDVPTGQVAPKFYGISNPTAVTTTANASITNRNSTGGASSATVAYGVSNSAPTGAANPIGNVFPTGGLPYDLNFERTLEPGASFVNYIVGTTTGIAGTNANCAITFTWYEEGLN